MRTVGPVDIEYVLFIKNIIIFSDFSSQTVTGVKHPHAGGNGQLL